MLVIPITNEKGISMKIVKGVLIALAALFVFVFGLVIASGINPRISEVLGEVLYAGREEE